MKKFKTFIIAFAAIMTMVPLSSCGSSNDDITGGGKEEITNVTGSITNSFLVSEYTLDAYEVNIACKRSDGSYKQMPISKDNANMLVTDELANKMTSSLKSWYENEKQLGSKVYYVAIEDNYKIPADFTFIVNPTFKYKGDNAVTHKGNTDKDWVHLHFKSSSTFVVNKSNKTTATADNNPRTFGEDWTIAPQKGQQIGEDYSGPTEYKVSATATTFNVK